MQVVARSVETALHKLFELGFDVRRIKAPAAALPLPPGGRRRYVGHRPHQRRHSLRGQVTLWVRGDDDSLAEIGPAVPADSSPAFGKPFLQVFEEAGRDFYKIDPHLFSPAEITFCNLETGKCPPLRPREPDVLKTSFGIG